MRVLLVNDYSTPTAGAEISLLRLCNRLRELGLEVRVFASDAELIAGPSFSDYSSFGTTTRWQALTSAFNVSARRSFARALDDFRPDIVHVNMFLWQLSPAILHSLADIPTVVLST